MFKKTKQGVEIDSQAADKAMAPRFKSRGFAQKVPSESPSQPSKPSKKKFGKKRARAQKVAVMLNKARKGA